MKVFISSLGCCKNLVDSEIIIKNFVDSGWELTDDEREADAIIVNTCGFIESAKQEAIDTIFELNNERKEGACLVVTGCLAQRYYGELFESMPEADLIIGIDKQDVILSMVEGFMETGERTANREKPLDHYENHERIITTPQGSYAYIRIADGCNNYCTFCAIPFIRGRYRSRKSEDIINEAKKLAKDGYRELILVAQDTTVYGKDINDLSLAQLIQKISEIEGIEWIRFLYAYPESVTDELINVITTNDKVVKYMDIPIQHCNDRILKKMNRRINRQGLEDLFAKLRNTGITLRTTVMTGFPTETEEEHRELLDFISKWKFDRLGAFAFSPEEGTGAYKMGDDVTAEVKERRLSEIMLLQKEISREKNYLRIGEKYTVAFDGIEDEKGFVARSESEVPEVDGVIYVTNLEYETYPGQTCEVIINDADEYDLYAQVLER